MLSNLEKQPRFEQSTREVLSVLYQHVGFNLWMMTRVRCDDWIVLYTEDHGYNVKEGTVFRWSDSFCSRMVRGQGPRVAPSAMEIPVYATAPIGKEVSIGAYIGVPVVDNDGALFGTLCAIDPMPQAASVQDKLPFIELFASLLGTILGTEQRSIELNRLLEICRQEAATDRLTGIQNRSGWVRSVLVEEARARRYGTPMSVFVIDLDNLKMVNDSGGHALGDELIRRTADCLQAIIRESDIVARLGGDEFAVLAMNCDKRGAGMMLKKIVNALKENGIEASVGNSTRDAVGGLAQTLERADRKMYAAKSARKSRLSS